MFGGILIPYEAIRLNGVAPKLIYRNIRPAIVGNHPIEAILFGCKGESYDNCGKRSFMVWYILLSVVRCDFCGLVC